MRRAFAYLRVSSQAQVELDGPERQEAAIRAFAAKQSLTIVKVFFEKGVSGRTEFEEREAWMEMLGEMSAGGAGLVVVEKLDRLARDLMVQEHIIKDLRKRKLEIISVAEPDLCIDDPSRKLMRQIMGSIAEYDRTMLTLRMRAGIERVRRIKGKCGGTHVFGEHPEKPEERDTLGVMRKLQRMGRSYHQIADHLNASEIAPRRGEQWHASAVRGILLRKKAKIAA